MALTNVRVLRKDNNNTIRDTSKVLKLIKREKDSLDVIYHGKHIVLTEKDGYIEIMKVNENDFPAAIAGNIVVHFQKLYDQVVTKLNAVAH